MEVPARGTESAVDREENGLRAKVEAGRKLTHIVAAFSVGMSATVIGLFVTLRGTERLPVQLGRFALTCVLAWLLLRGYGWARRLVGLLLVFSGWSAVSSVAEQPDELRSYWLAGMGLAYGICVVRSSWYRLRYEPTSRETADEGATWMTNEQMVMP